MKRIILNKIKNQLLFIGVLSVLIVSSCSEKEEGPKSTSKVCQIKGRWISTSYPNTLYEFTDSLKYTIYTVDGTFGTIADAIPSPKNWWIEKDSIKIDLNFGHVQTAKVVFRCDCNVMEMHQSKGEPIRFHKEGFDPKTCP